MPPRPSLTSFVTTACVLAVVMARRARARMAVPAGRHDSAESGRALPPRSRDLPATVQIAGTTVAAHELLAAAVSAPARPGRPYESAARAALRLIPGWGDPREANRLGAVAEHLCVTPQALARMSLDEARYVAELLCELDTPSNVRAFAVTCTPASDDHAAPGRSPVLAAAS